MSSLADELLDDLGDLGDDPYAQEEPKDRPDRKQVQFKVPTVPGPGSLKRKAAEEAEDEEMASGSEEGDGEGENAGIVLEGGVKPAEELDKEEVEGMELGSVKDVTSVAKLEGSRRMTEILKVNTIPFCNLMQS